MSIANQMRSNSLLYAALLAILVDILVTVRYWKYEANPIVLEMTKLEFILLKTFLAYVLRDVYVLSKPSYPTVVNGLTGFIAVFHSLIVIMNIWVVL